MRATFQKYILNFRRPGGTSRGVLTTKETFILKIKGGDKIGIGECALFHGLSADDRPDYEEKLQCLCDNINENESFLKQELLEFPSIWFGFEQAVLNLRHGGNLYFPGEFTNGEKKIRINGLIWMGDADFMQQQIDEKLSAGFHCLKLKIGTEWDSEKKIIEKLRKIYPENRLELRVDANGAFTFNESQKVLEELAALKIHSIEQPIKAGNPDQMAELCKNTPTPIALDEELIGIFKNEDKIQLLNKIIPQYIILKPALVGGFSGSDEWISAAKNLGIDWWITSALESNIGLNAIAQYTATKDNPLLQGLGTGALFTNNFESALNLQGEWLGFK